MTEEVIIAVTGLVFGRCSDRISACTSVILTEVFFRGAPQSLQVNSGTVPGLSHDHFHLNPFQFIIVQSVYHSKPHNLNNDNFVK
jgi:hypothetical protein